MRTLAALSVVLLLAAPSLPADTFTFTHYAGSIGGASSIDGEAAVARFNSPVGLEAGDGVLFVSDQYGCAVRVVDLASGAVTTFAGMSESCSAADGGRGAARFTGPAGMKRDAAGNLFVADQASHTIRKITPGGAVSTYAGLAGVPGAVNGARGDSRFRQPMGLAFDSLGNLFVADMGNHAIRKITPAGVVSTFAGTAGTSGSTDGAVEAALFDTPRAVAVDADDHLYVADAGNCVIRRVAEGLVSTVAGTAGGCAQADGIGSAARFSSLSGIAISPTGVLYISDGTTVRTVTIAANQYVVATLAGAPFMQGYVDATGAAARFGYAQGIVFHPDDASLYVADSPGAIRRVTTAGVVTTVAGRGNVGGYQNGTGSSARFNWPGDLAVTPAGDIYVADTSNHVIRKIVPPYAEVSLASGTPGTVGSSNEPGHVSYNEPSGVALDAAGNLYIADTGNHVIRKIDGATHVVSTFAGTAAMSGSDDGTGAEARFNAPVSVASDGTNVYVADRDNHTIRKITSARVVTTLAGHAGESGSADGTALARFNQPSAVAADSNGNVYVADAMNFTVRKVTSGGVVSTLAGSPSHPVSEDGTGSEAHFKRPEGITVEDRGGQIYLYVTDRPAQAIRMIAPGNVVTTVGGRHNVAGTTDGTGDVARFSAPRGLELYNGTLYIAESNNHCIRRGAPALATVATIDHDSGEVGAMRHLGAAPVPTKSSWTLTRTPTGSHALLSSTTTSAPTFTPDIPDIYRFRLTATTGTSRSITEVELNVLCPSITLDPASLPDAQVGLAYSQALTADNGAPPYEFSVASGTVPTGLTLTSAGNLAGTPTALGSFTFTARATDYYGCTVSRSYTIVVRMIQPPAGLSAIATAVNSVSLTWNASAGAVGYRVYRGTSMGALSLLVDVGGLSHTDGTVAAGTAYLYKVRAYDAGGHESVDSAGDIATTVAFTDAALVSGMTVKAVHVTQLRTAVNAVRTLAGLGAFAWSDAALDAGTPVRALHVSNLRTAITAARTALGLATSFAEPSLGAGDDVRAVHVTDLRNAVK